MIGSHLSVEWVDGEREPQCQPNPEFPNGMDVDASNGAERTCTARLPYPAKRCGIYIVRCSFCRVRAAITTAGRADDPKSLKIACRALAGSA